MDEEEWASSEDPQKMLAALRRRGSERKFRLFMTACCRRIWPLLKDGRSRAAVECTEEFVDGKVAGSKLWAARKAAERAWKSRAARAAATASAVEFTLYWLLPYPCEEEGAEDSEFAHLAGSACALASEAQRGKLRAAEPAAQCALLGCIFGDPFRPLALDATRQTPTIASLARAAYDERLLPSGHLDPVRLAVLADALEEAGAEAAILHHLRGPGPHVRGCFVLDLVLGKE